MSKWTDASENFFSEERLVAGFKQSRGLPLGELVGGLIEEVQKFARGHPQADDVTLLVVRYLG